MAEEKCPKCGADAYKFGDTVPESFKHGVTFWVCGTFLGSDGTLYESPDCLRRQLAAKDARIAQLERQRDVAVVRLACATWDRCWQGKRIFFFGDQKYLCPHSQPWIKAKRWNAKASICAGCVALALEEGGDTE